jgi:predicted nucleotidyltransferase
MEIQLDDLPANVKRILTEFMTAAKAACESNLVSIVLFGSAAEGRLRPTSDINLILVLKAFSVPQIDGLRENLRTAHAAIRLSVMFLLESEIAEATEAFAVKFSDILSRHRILFGSNPFIDVEVSRSATLRRLNQVLVNLTLRLRERYAMVSLREEQLVTVIADTAGPLRSCAATLVRLEGGRETHPKEALEALVKKLPEGDWSRVLGNMSISRETQELQPGEAAATVVGLFALLSAIHNHAQSLK